MTNQKPDQYDRFPRFLSGNTLKILAAIFMTIDHIGVILFPRVLLLRLIGRLAMPIYAFMIAEGCKYTRNRKKYFGTVFGLGAVCQTAYYLFDGSLYFSILITFSLSILMIYALQDWKEKKTALSGLVFGAAVAAVSILPALSRWHLVSMNSRAHSLSAFNPTRLQGSNSRTKHSAKVWAETIRV